MRVQDGALVAAEVSPGLQSKQLSGAASPSSKASPRAELNIPNETWELLAQPLLEVFFVCLPGNAKVIQDDDEVQSECGKFM